MEQTGSCTVARHSGRGALGNPVNRFEAVEVIPDPEFYEEDPRPLKTRFFRDDTRSILSRNDSPDVGFNVTVNPYRGCEHGCIYCYARPTHEYLGMSCGLDFESRIFVKMDAPKLLREALSKQSWEPQPIGFSGVTDCYQPAERAFKLTRQCLEVLAEFGNPVGLITKNYLITRDIDVLSDLAKKQAAHVSISLTTLDETLAGKMEPRTSRPAQRLKAIRKLAEAGIPVAVMMAPIIPGLTDSEIDAVLKQAADAGAWTAGFTLLRLPYGVQDLFQGWVREHYPLRANKILNRVSDVRGGRLNDARFVHRMRGEGAYADYIQSMFQMSCRRYGLTRAWPELSVEHFRRPGSRQLTLF
ncbi:MAG TPA: PA0069 family radical SAM protein [Oculatellaceae cyanobacterium]|jgi:DNA repair photolyase